MIPFLEETVAVQRPTFESIADDLEAYQETLLMLEAETANYTDLESRNAAIDEHAEVLVHIEHLSAALVKKTDDLACVLRRLKSDSTFLKSEEERLRQRRKANEAALEGLKSYTQATMERHGYKHLKTAKNTIAIRGNGGLAPLVISQPDLVPDELCEWQGVLPNEMMRSVLRAVERAEYWTSDQILKLLFRFKRVPVNASVREALIQPCAECDGTGKSYEAALCASEGTCTCPSQQCPICGGSGKASVPGAHLEARGSHVEVR